MVEARHISPDKTLTLVVIEEDDGGDITLGFEGFPWHTHGDLLASSFSFGNFSGLTSSSAAARFVEDVIGNRAIIVVRALHDAVCDVWVTDDPTEEFLSEEPGESLQFRYWDGRTIDVNVRTAVANIRASCSPSVLDRKSLWDCATRWRQVFARRVQETTGKSMLDGCDWHAFSRGIAPCVTGGAARSEYRRRSAASGFLVLVGSALDAGLRCASGPLPWFDEMRQDVYIIPEDYSWTMVFTHEGDSFGPYFATSEST